jgi:hypothetical protein
LSKDSWKRKTYISRKDPEIAIYWQFLVPETVPFWRFLAPESGTRNHQNGAVSGAINCKEMAISGAINCQNGRHILYDFGIEDNVKTHNLWYVLL